MIILVRLKGGFDMSGKKSFAYGAKCGIPILLGYIAVSFTFGIAATASGLKPLQAIIMSATNFTSAGQFAALSVIAGGETYIELALTQLVINLRYCLMSSALSQKFDKNSKIVHKLIFAFGNTDEVFGVASMQEDCLSAPFCYGLLSTGLIGWVIGTAIGAFCGNILPESVLSALGVALYGMFIAIIVPPARHSKTLTSIIAISMILSTVFTKVPFLKEISSGFRIIILTVVISAVFAILFPKKEGAANE